MHHPKQNPNRMHVPRREEGREMINLEMLSKIAISGLIWKHQMIGRVANDIHWIQCMH